MTAPLRHPVIVGGEAVTDADLAAALRTLAAVMAAHGDAAMPIFERLEAEYDARARRHERFRRFLDV